MKFISLGGNCSITYQLYKYNLREEAYPFDWSKLTINQLINVLKNNFDLYSETLLLKYKSNNHYLFNKDFEKTDIHQSIILTNSYNIEFSHEINKIENLINFKDSLNRRIVRFQNLSRSTSTSQIDEKIIFIRIELSPIKISYENNIKILLELLNKYSSNYELRLIINSDIQFTFPDNIKIYRFNKFSEDWQMNHINWSEICSFSSGST